MNTTTKKTAKEILNERYEAIKDRHLVLKDVLSTVLTDENHLPNVTVYVTYNNPGMWFTNVNISGCDLKDLTPEEARIVAAWFIEKYARACGMPRVYIDHTASENRDFADLVSGAYHELHVISDNIRVNNHWGTKEQAGIYVGLRAPKVILPLYAKRFIMNRFAKKG